MPKKYRFRKVYFVCRNNQVYSSSARTEPSFLFKKDAEQLKKTHEDEYKPYVINSPSFVPPPFTVEGFYLVHESLYNELLKQFDKEPNITRHLRKV
ncbi:hypothetical protein IDJ77_11455 [Mucilaginibacter sp. ZT4R22]|uniref:Uncharacterized protein n=1 Tax=Mucilaginibacter pankratovii TaxID=2772110 RepID=A0ABR7WQ33_9SPHI|nr:hypothetical protein [Mucilaginibacter pankratovii]